MGKGIRHVDWSHTATLVEAIAARHRMTANNINKNISAKMRQPERENSFKPPEKSADIPIQALRARKRATVERQKGPGCIATGALLQARLAHFRPGFGLQSVSIKFKQLTISVFKKPTKSPIYAERLVRCKYRKQRGQK